MFVAPLLFRDLDPMKRNRRVNLSFVIAAITVSFTAPALAETSGNAFLGAPYREASDNWFVGSPLDTAMDVQTAYVRIKREFGFSTDKERLANTPGVYGDIGTLYSVGFAYASEPGAYYLMRDNTASTQRIVQVEISKSGEGALVEYAFATAGLENAPEYDFEIQKRIRSALESK